MSSPLSMFRKHQKILLAVFGIAIVFVFAVGYSAQQLLDLGTRGGGTKSEKVALTWSEGEITNGELDEMVHTHNALTQYLSETQERARPNDIRPRADALRPQGFQTVEQQRRSAVQTMLLAKRAEQLGIVISKAVVIDYIKGWTDDSLKSDVLAEIRKNARMTEPQLFAILRRELMAQKLLIMASYANEVGTPAQLYEYAGRLSRKAQFEFLPIQVAKYLDRQNNPAPSEDQEEELRKFYDECKGRVKRPDMFQPGLREPYRASVEFLRADLDKFVERARAKVTEDEILNYYDRRKDFAYVIDPLFEEFDEALPPNPDPLPANPDPKPPATGNRASKPAGQFNVQDAATDGKATATDKKATDKTADPKKSPPAKSGDAKSADKPSTAKPLPDAKKSNEKLPGDKKTGDKKPEDIKPEVKYKPLSEVREEIRKELGRRGAATEIMHVFGDIGQLKSITTYRTKYDDWQYSDADGGPPTGDPPLSPLKQIAEAYDGLSYGVTDMLSVYEASDTEDDEANVAKRFAKDFSAAFRSRDALPLLSVQHTLGGPQARLKSLSQNTPYLADGDGNGYFCWKIKDRKTRVPELSEIRDKAIRAWKMKKARELARKQADVLAKQARENGGKLKGAFKDELATQVIQPDPFSRMKVAIDFEWFQQTQQFRMSPQPNWQIEGIEYIGGEFLETIFALEPGGLEIVFNYPQEIVYVVRMNSIEPADPQQLLGNLNNTKLVSRNEGAAVRRDWYQAIEEEFEVEWKTEEDE